jgi:hypothetical protein
VTNARSTHKESTATTDQRTVHTPGRYGNDEDYAKVAGGDLAGTGIHGPRDALSRGPVANVAIKKRRQISNTHNLLVFLFLLLNPSHLLFLIHYLTITF